MRAQHWLGPLGFQTIIRVISYYVRKRRRNTTLAESSASGDDGDLDSDLEIDDFQHKEHDMNAGESAYRTLMSIRKLPLIDSIIISDHP